MARYNSSYHDYFQYLSLPVHFFFFIGITFIFLIFTWYINYESKFEDFMDNFKLCLMVFPVILLLFVHWLSSNDPERVPFNLSLPEKDSLHRVGGSPLLELSLWFSASTITRVRLIQLSMEDESEWINRALSLTEEEEEGWTAPTDTWQNSTTKNQFWIVGKILCNKAPKFDNFRLIMFAAISTIKGMEIKKLDGGRFLMIFFHEIDRHRVINGAPWNFDKNLLILRAIETKDDPMLTELKHCDFYILVKGLPLGLRTNQMGKFIGDKLGICKDVDVSKKEGFSFSSALRIRVGLDMTKPLRRAMKFMLDLNVSLRVILH